MKPIPRHTHSIEMEFTNKATKLLCFRITIPMNKTDNYISNWYKKTKQGVASAEGVPEYRIVGKHNIIESKIFDTILFEWAGGISLSMPDRATPYDYQIVLKQLEVIRMSLD